MADLIVYAREVIGAMEQLGLTLSDLTRVELLPQGLAQDELAGIIQRFTIAPPTGTSQGGSPDLLPLRNLSQAFGKYGPCIGWAIERFCAASSAKKTVVAVGHAACLKANFLCSLRSSMLR
jgi:hypothetical protein